MNFKKILEIKGTDWMKGFSQQAGIALGGNMQNMTSFNPFESMGFLQPSLLATELTAPATDPIKTITSFNLSGVGYFYGHSNSKLYAYLVNSPYTQSADLSSGIDVTSNLAGAIIWKGKYIYNHGGAGSDMEIRSAVLGSPPTSDTLICNTYTYTDVIDIRHMAIGADGNLYVADAADTAGGLIKLTNTTANNGAVVTPFSLDIGFTARGLYNDGKYLVILADNNASLSTARVVGDYRCRVYFWDMGKATADVIWDISDSYLIGGGFLDGKMYVFGYNGIYVCNLATSPKLIWDFRGNSTVTYRPTSPYQIVVGSEDIYWANGDSSGVNRIYAIRGQVVYQPYDTASGFGTHYASAISKIGNTFIASTTEPKIYIHNVGTTRATTTIQTTNETLPQPWTYGFTKVALKSPLSSGQSVQVSLYSNAGNTIISTTATKSFSADGALKHLIFNPSPASGSVTNFEDVSVYLTLTGGVVIERVTVYGTPLDDLTQS